MKKLPETGRPALVLGLVTLLVLVCALGGIILVQTFSSRQLERAIAAADAENIEAWKTGAGVRVTVALDYEADGERQSAEKSTVCFSKQVVERVGRSIERRTVYRPYVRPLRFWITGLDRDYRIQAKETFCRQALRARQSLGPENFDIFVRFLTEEPLQIGRRKLKLECQTSWSTETLVLKSQDLTIDTPRIVSVETVALDTVSAVPPKGILSASSLVDGLGKTNWRPSFECLP